MWEWDSNFLMVLVTVVGVLVSCATIVIDRFRANESRQRELFMQLYDSFASSDFQKSWSDVIYNWQWESTEDFLKKYGPGSNLAAWASATSVSLYFEGIGVLVKKKMININLVGELMSTTVKWFWEKTARVTRDYRQMTSNQHLFENFEYLYAEIDRREKVNAEKTRKTGRSA